MIKGNLEIGDEWNAIQIIAHSQSSPQKAVAELIENSIDAKATSIVIERKKRKGKILLTVSDDGIGVRHNGKIPPESLGEVPKRICDSIKRKLASSERKGIHGQFGIGLLGFWSLGKRLLIRSKTSASRTYTLEMEAGKREFRVGQSNSERGEAGTDILVEDVHKEVQNRLAAERLANYISHELRDRMRQSNATITIHDRLTRKTLTVVPSTFRGEAIATLQQIKMPARREIRSDLYLISDAEGPPPKIGIAVDGTRVIEDITSLDEFRNPPWTSGRLEGVMDWPELRISPTRKDLVLDSSYQDFVTAVKGVEGELLRIIKESERSSEEQIGRDVLKELKRAFESAFADLPRADYSWFGVRNPGPIPGDKTETRKEREVPCEIDEPRSEPSEERQEGLILERVVLTPSVATVTFGAEKRFVARSFDADGKLVVNGVEYKWAISNNRGEWIREISPTTRVFLAKEEAGECEVIVEARQEGISCEARATVVIVPEKPALEFPPPLETFQPLERWRSRWVETTGNVEINSGHKDYLRSKAAGRNVWRKYLAALYSKELVLLNFGEFPPAEILERMVEIVSSLETKL